MVEYSPAHLLFGSGLKKMTERIQIPFVDLQAQYKTIAKEINAAIQRVLDRSDYVLGEEVRLFEEDFAKFIGTTQAIGVGSGLDALELALRAYGIGPGDEVITAANTYIATVLAIIAAGARPVLVDMDPSTYNISPNAIEAAITPRTRGIMPVHLYGEFPATEAAANRILSLPMYPELTEKQREYVASNLLESSRESPTKAIQKTTI